MKIRYVRFKQAVMQPGPAGVQIDTARLKASGDDRENTLTKREALMSEIFLDEETGYLTLRCSRQMPSGKHAMFERHTHVTNCVDWEEVGITPSETERKTAR